MNVQIENIMPEGFVYEKVHNVMHGAVNGIALLIVPIMAENQFRIQLHGDIERSGKKENFLEFLKVLDSVRRSQASHHIRVFPSQFRRGCR